MRATEVLCIVEKAWTRGNGIMVVLLLLTAVMCLSEPYLLTVDMWHGKPFSNKITDAYKTKPVVDA